MIEKRCPVAGVDRTQAVDRIMIENAVETPFWMAVWAVEPERLVDVRMSYSDLKVICDLINEKMVQNQKKARGENSDKNIDSRTQTRDH